MCSQQKKNPKQPTKQNKKVKQTKNIILFFKNELNVLSVPNSSADFKIQ